MKKKKNTVTAWAFVAEGIPFISKMRKHVCGRRNRYVEVPLSCGPITRIELPLPKSKKASRALR